jgi:hypothetical protein
VDLQHGLAAGHLQAGADVVEEQAEATQGLAQRRAHGGLAGQGMAQHGKCAHLHAPGVEAEELVVQRPGHRHPQPCKRLGRHARGILRQQWRGDARLGQHGGAASRVQRLHGAAHEGDGHAALGQRGVGGHRCILAKALSHPHVCAIPPRAAPP